AGIGGRLQPGAAARPAHDGEHCPPDHRPSGTVRLQAHLDSVRQLRQSRTISQVPSTLEQDLPKQNPQSQSLSLAHAFTVHPPCAAVVSQTELSGQPVWLHGSAWQPWVSVNPAPTAHANPVGQVYPASQSTGTQPWMSAPAAPGAEQAVPSGQTNP